MRELTEVIDQVLAEVPAEGFADLRRKLESVRYSAGFSAPEAMGMWWKNATGVLSDELGERMGEDWVKRVVWIWSGKL